MRNFLIISFLLFAVAFAAENTGKFDNITTNTPSKTTIDLKKNVDVQTTGGIYLPSGTTGQRPTPTKEGLFRYNSTNKNAEIYADGAWGPIGGGISLWVTAKAYKIGDVVIESNKIYRCIANHTSGTFATDIGNWVELSPTEVINLATGVTGVLPVANGGTGSATKNFVDLSTVQVVGGNKTFSTTGATTGTIVTHNGSGDALFVDQQGAGLALNVNGDSQLVGGLVVTGNLSATNFSGTSSGTNTGDLLSQGLNEGSASVTNTISAPYNQITTTATGVRNIETGSQNMLINGEIEGLASPIPNGWTCTSGTCTKTTVSGEFSSGKAALKVALSSQVMNVSQSVNTPSGIQKQGYARVIYRVPATMADFQICSLVDAAEQTCVPSSYLVKDDTFRTAEIPLTFGATSAGIKFKTTSAYTGNAFFDGAIVAQGLGTQNLMLDNVYSAKVSSAGVVSDENIDWINGNCSYTSLRMVCPVKSGISTLPMNCNATPTYSAGWNGYIGVTSITSSEFQVQTIDNNNNNNLPFVISCKKQGTDYLSASANAYAATNGNYDPITFTPTMANIGTPVLTNTCKQWRTGGYLNVSCSFPVGAVAASLFSFTLPNSLQLDASKIVSTNTTAGTGSVVGKYSQNTTGGYGHILANTGSSTTLLYLGGQGSQAAQLTPQTAASVLLNSTQTDLSFSVPILGWSNSNIIVGSFEGIEKCANEYECTDTFSASMDSAGAVTLENTDWINGSCSNPSTGNYTCTFKSGIFTTAPNCVVTGVNGNRIVNVSPTTSSSVGIIATQDDGSFTALSLKIICQKSGIDYRPKTAKVASSIGVNVTSGIDSPKFCSFFVSNGSGAETACSSASCTTQKINGNCATTSSVTRSGAGRYTYTFNSGSWSNPSGVNCDIQLVGGGNGRLWPYIGNTFNTSTRVINFDNAASNGEDASFNVFCHGE
jgi:hypothetical protein